jgi:aminoglycoside 6'-N-acetyltransferase
VIDAADSTVTYAIEADGEVIGIIQYAEEIEPDYRHASIDIFEERGHHRITIDPAVHNERAIRSYRRVGFQPVGLMRRYERGLDGRRHDRLRMDLLPEDLAQSDGRLRAESSLGPT